MKPKTVINRLTGQPYEIYPPVSRLRKVADLPSEATAPATTLAVSAGGRRVAVADTGGAVRVYDAAGRTWATLPAGHGRLQPVERLAVARDGGRVAAVAGGRLACHPTAGAGKAWRTGPRFGAVTDAAFAPDGRWLLAVTREGRAVRLDAATGKESGGWDWGVGALYAAAVAPNGLTAAVGAVDGVVVVWDVDG